MIPNSGDVYSVNKPGFNAGMGVAMGTKWHGKVFAEARYVHVFLNNNMRADYVPGDVRLPLVAWTSIRLQTRRIISVTIVNA